MSDLIVLAQVPEVPAPLWLVTFLHGLAFGIAAGLAVPFVMFLYAKRPSTGRLVLALGLALIALTGKTVLRFAMRASRREGGDVRGEAGHSSGLEGHAPPKTWLLELTEDCQGRAGTASVH